MTSLQQGYKITRLEERWLEPNLKVIMPQKFLNQIKYLCRGIHNVEWSGVLFYSVDGSIQDPENCIITLEEIHLMDKGSGAETTYSFDETVAEFIMDDFETRSEWKMGLIHSHHNMNTYFSGVDVAELQTNAQNHNYYLSLIVNNRMDFTARVAFVGEAAVPDISYKCQDEHGNTYSVGNDLLSKKLLFLYDCDIEYPKSIIEVSQSFEDRMEFIIEEKERLAAAAKAKAKAKADAAEAARKRQALISKNKLRNQPHKNPLRTQPDVDEIAEFFANEMDVAESFATFVLRFGNDSIPNDNLEQALEDVEIGPLDDNVLITSLIAGYPAYYERYFDDFGGNSDDETFLSMLKSVIEAFKEYEEEFVISGAIAVALEHFGDKYEEAIDDKLVKLEE